MDPVPRTGIFTWVAGNVNTNTLGKQTVHMRTEMIDKGHQQPLSETAGIFHLRLEKRLTL